MTSDPVLIERQMAEVELRPFTLDEFHRRRHRKRRNRRIATAVIGVALVAGAVGAVQLTPGQGDETVDTDILGPTPSPFVGEWVSTDTDGSSQTMEVLRTDGDEHDVVIHDDAATVCSGAPSTMTGAGRLTSITEVVLPRPVLACDDGTTPTILGGPRLEEELANLTFVHDPETDQLWDSLGVVWRRPGAPSEDPSEDGGPVLGSPSPFAGSWRVGQAGQYFPDSLEITVIGDEDLHEVVTLKAETPQCAGGPSTMRGTGRRESPVQLVVVVDLTCDDGSTPVPQSPQEEGMFDDLGITFTHDPVTDELGGSLGSTFVRDAEPAPG